jgi:hypothetical protein
VLMVVNSRLSRLVGQLSKGLFVLEAELSEELSEEPQEERRRRRQ